MEGHFIGEGEKGCERRGLKLVQFRLWFRGDSGGSKGKIYHGGVEWGGEGVGRGRSRKFGSGSGSPCCIRLEKALDNNPLARGCQSSELRVGRRSRVRDLGVKRRRGRGDQGGGDETGEKKELSSAEG